MTGGGCRSGDRLGMKGKSDAGRRGARTAALTGRCVGTSPASLTHLVHSQSVTAVVQELYAQLPFLTLALAIVLHVVQVWCQLADGGGTAAGLDPLNAARRQQHPTVVLPRAIAAHVFGAVVAPDAQPPLGKARVSGSSRGRQCGQGHRLQETFHGHLPSTKGTPPLFRGGSGGGRGGFG